ncbi:MAG: hypothetical protein KatS3mg059_0246 [Thermomicrobiales bacterium]|nr:MAG: hypothetical protein KatS3mg059_0246 [Thermomicrobiales bacterium]
MHQRMTGSLLSDRRRTRILPVIFRWLTVLLLALPTLHQAPFVLPPFSSGSSGTHGLAQGLLQETATPGTTLRVPDQYPTIQAAINAAASGDLVLIAPGTYSENPVIAGKVITLASHFFTTGDTSFIDATILQGNGSSQGITVQATAAGTSIIGLTIRSGGAGVVDGVHALGSVTVRHNHIIGYDDGIDFGPPTGSTGTCTCQFNTIEGGTDDGIDLDGASNGLLEGNVLRNNHEDGIEIRFHDYAGTLSIVIRGNRLQGNGQDGIQLIDLPGASDRRVRIERNVIVANGRAGLGLMDGGNSGEDYRAASLLDPIDLINNTFVGNDHAVSGGDNLVAVNNVVVNAKRFGLKNVDGNSIAAYNLFWNNPTNFTGSNVDQTTTVLADPLLSPDYTLSAGSPAIDAGTAAFQWRGQPVVDMPSSAYIGAAPDLGAYESGEPGPTPSPTPVLSPTPGGQTSYVLVGAGDIASESNGDEITAALLDGIEGTVFTLGDNVYESGTIDEFMTYYEPTWGRHKARTRPAPGDHDYFTAGAAGYFSYFGSAAGDPSRGYYSYDFGSWHVVALNTKCDEIGGCGPGSPQELWLRADLAAHPSACTVAYMHHPRFSSGSTHGSQAFVQPLWEALYEAGVDIVLAGHEHNYERFAPQNPAGDLDTRWGIREFVVGTGGRTHYGFGAPLPNSEVREASTFGVLKLTLHDGGYEWDFVPEPGSTFSDRGTGTCHEAPPSPTPTPDATPTQGATPAGEQTVVLTPEADARVEAANPNTNYGTASTLIIDGDPLRESYVRFNVQGTGTIQQATLRLFASNGTTKAPRVYLAGNDWTETGITWNTKPAALGGGVAGPASFPDNTWVEFDVTSLVTGPGQVTFTFPPVSSDGITFHAREMGTNIPQLVLRYSDSGAPTTTPVPAGTASPSPSSSPATGPTATLTSTATITPPSTPAATAMPPTPGGEQQVVFTPEADARVEAANPNANFGTATALSADLDRAEESYLRFTIGGITGTVQQAKLRLYATGSTVDGPQVYTANNTWTETAITWNTKPALLTGPSGDTGAITSGTWVEFDVTPLVPSDGTITLALIATSSDGVTFSSREASSNRPQLVIKLAGNATLTVTPEPTPEGAPPTPPNTPEATPTNGSTQTPSPSATSSVVSTATSIPTFTPTQTATALPTPTVAPTATAIPGGETLFADGFETGNLARWSRVKGLTVQQEIVLQGAFAARGTSTQAATYARATLPAPQSDVYFRVYIYIASQSNNTVYLMRCRTANDKSILGVYVNGSGRLGYRNDVSGLSTTTATVVARNAWHEVVLHAKVNGTSGQVEIWF